MKEKVTRWFLIVLALLPFGGSAQSVMAIEKNDTLSIRFRSGQSEVDLTFEDNQQQVDRFISHIKAMDRSSLQNSSIRIYGGASPEGIIELNRRLGESRALALRHVLVERLRSEGLSDISERLQTVNQGPRWGALYQMVSERNEPWADEVLKVLRKKDRLADDWSRDPREVELRRLHKGAIWHILNTRYLPPLRSVGSAVISKEPLVVTDAVTGVCDTLVMRDTVYYLPEPIPYREGYSYRGRGWALKTNLVPWVIATPNLQWEHTLGYKNKWSIELEAMAAWWTLSHNAYANEILYGSVELRRWLGNRRVRHALSGWHVGLAVGGGYYDFEWKSDGYQGEVINAYINIGYQHRFGHFRQWLFDASVGLGYLYSPYRKYYGSSKFPTGHEEQYDDHLMWQETNRRNWFGATHANITIGYVFGADKPVKYTYEEATPYLEKMNRLAEKKAKREQKRAMKAKHQQADVDERVTTKNLEAASYSMTAAQQDAAWKSDKQARRDRKAREAAERKAAKAAARQARIDEWARKKVEKERDEEAWRKEKAERKAEKQRIAAEQKAARARQKAELKAAKERERAELKAAAGRAAATLKKEQKARQTYTK